MRGLAAPKGFTLIEAMLAFAVLTTALLALYSTLTRAILLSETSKQVKIAIFDAQSIAEEIQGTDFDKIMDPDWPNFETPQPKFRHRQLVDLSRVGQPAEPHLDGEEIRVWYGSGLDTLDANGNGNTTDALPLAIVPGSDLVANLEPTAAQPNEQFRPVLSAGSSQFMTPEPLYITVEVSWIGPVKANDSFGNPIRSFQRITFVRSR